MLPSFIRYGEWSASVPKWIRRMPPASARAPAAGRSVTYRAHAAPGWQSVWASTRVETNPIRPPGR